MSRRKRKKEELDTGNDSFLDIIANIVGILIILIVIAGVRVSQLPATGDAEAPPPPSLVAIPTDEEDVPEIEVSLGAASSDPDEGILPLEPPPAVAEVIELPKPEPPPKPSPQLLAEITLLKQEIEGLKEETTGTEPRIVEILESATEKKQQLEASREIADQKADQLVVVKTRLDTNKQQLENDMRQLARLAEEAEQKRETQPNVKQLVHRLTPVSKVVEGRELHFRLENNRVSRVPIKQLIAELKSRIERRKSWLARNRSHHGHVGPIDGYRMRYLVERKPLSMVEELHHGSGMFRVIVSAWQMQVTPDLKAETAEDALQLGSRFVAALQEAQPKTTLTFWVYPDSFSLFRQLQAAAHANGFMVAARPLPHGIPIAGSPSGTRSAGQ